MNDEIIYYAKCILWRLSKIRTNKTLQELRDIAVAISLQLAIDTVNLEEVCK